MFQRILRSLAEAMPKFDLSDTPVEKPQPVVKRPPPTPIAALRRGVKQPIKNKLPGIHGAPTADTVSALKAIKREDWQALAGLVKEARSAVGEGVFDAVGAAAKQLLHPINMVKKIAAGDLGREYAAQHAKGNALAGKKEMAATIRGHGYAVTPNGGEPEPGAPSAETEEDEEMKPKKLKMKESIDSIRKVMEGGGSRMSKDNRQMAHYKAVVPKNTPADITRGFTGSSGVGKRNLRTAAFAFGHKSDPLAKRDKFAQKTVAKGIKSVHPAKAYPNR